jgi:hypothetical protein
MQFNQRGQETGERLVATGWRYQQRGAARSRLSQQFELMRARRPATAGEPSGSSVPEQSIAVAGSIAQV